MSKMFYNLKPEHIEGLSYWFWHKEGIAMMREMLPLALVGSWKDKRAMRTFKFWVELLFYLPVATALIMLFGGYIGRRHARICTKNQMPLEIFNKNNIEYFTVLAMMYGVNQRFQEDL